MIMISIVIPVFSGGPFLGQTIDSVLNQTYQKFEIILVDNNASEATRNIALNYVKNYPQKIIMIKEANQGVCSARNAGILAATGKYIALLDDDDIMLPNNLEHQLKVFNENPNISMVFCGQHNIDKISGEIIEKNIFGAHGQWKIREDLVRKAMAIALENRNCNSFRFSVPSTMFFKKETAMRIGLFDERMNTFVGEDDDFCIRMFFEGDFIMNKEELLLYRKEYEDNKRGASSKYLFHFINQFNKLYGLMWKKLGRNDPRSKKVFRDLSIHELTNIFWTIVKFSGDPKDKVIIQTLLFREWRQAPFRLYNLKLFLKSFLPHSYYPTIFWFDRFHSESLDPTISIELVKKIFTIPV